MKSQPQFILAFLVLAFISHYGFSYTLNPPLTKTAYLDEVQVLADMENGIEYSYARVYFTMIGSGTQECWVVPLERNGVEYNGSKFIQAMLQQAIASKAKVFLHAVDTWGLGSQSFFSLFESPRIRRIIVYK